MRTLTPSDIAAFTHCPRRYQYSCLWKLSPILYNSSSVINAGLRAGIAQVRMSPRSTSFDHAMVRASAAMKNILLKCKKLMDQDEFEEVLKQAKRDRIKVSAMVHAYLVHYTDSPKMAQVECHITPRPIMNPSTGKKSRTFKMGGVFDGYYRLKDRRVVICKIVSTSDSLREAKQILFQDVQLQLLLSMMPAKVDLAGICVDLVKKPVVKFSKAKDDPLQHYEDRCLEAYIKDPYRFFQRIMLPVDPNRIRDAQAVAWRIAQEIRDSDRHGYLACRGQNCRNHKGWCEYRALCWYQHTENYVHEQ